MDLFAKFTAKDRLRIPAEFYNLVVDAVRFYLQSRPDRKAEKIAVQGPTRFGIKNVSGSTLEQYAVVGIGAGLAVPGGDDTYYYGDAYFESAAPAAASPFAILQEPAVDNAFSSATCAGFSFVRISVTNTAHAYAVPSAGVYTHLVSQSAVGPATILWKETGGTLLNGAINNSVTYITVDSGADFPDAPFVVTLDSEDLNVTAKYGTTQLNGAIDDVQTSITVDSAAGFPSATPFVVVIGTERMNVTGGGGTTTWTVTRGYQNSTADQHGDNSPVTALADTYWTVTRAYNSTSAASHSDNVPVTMKSGVVWALVRIDSQGSGGSGVTSINGDSTAAHVFSVGTSGTDFAITDTGAGTLRWDLPDASASNRGAVTTGTQTIAGGKTFTSLVIGSAGFAGGSLRASASSYPAYRVGGSDTVSWCAAIRTEKTSGETIEGAVYPEDTYTGTHNPMFLIQTLGATKNPVYAVETIAAGGTKFGVYGTSGGGDTVSGGIITALGSPSAGSLTGTVAKANGGTGENNSTGGTANTFWARPDGATGAASYRVIVGADLPIGTDVQAWSAELDSLLTAMPAADIGALTDSTGGTANTTLVAVAGTGDDANINDNFADLAAQVNAVRAALQALGLMA